ncbi:hypothetical protein HanRHA438_Chr09g0387941 [Helianthus annuus]|nr:hypothetical protein HanRHA438_Chr09g0387941 [Helianthus annuus]
MMAADSLFNGVWVTNFEWVTKHTEQSKHWGTGKTYIRSRLVQYRDIINITFGIVINERN